MQKQHKAIEIEAGSGNVYEAIGQPDANEMQVEAQLAKIGEIPKAGDLTHLSTVKRQACSCNARRIICGG
ncbi:hypothetical protein [Pseudomonas sp. CHM02]|uniref:hypothetical protein n=1 Tax=Pseudomonas sp. CHM02 TaxID=1463662 RepID=UPI000AE7EBEA|nr:hypothetical protein [Pseudomonas sp. CHM02]